jgi:hypothetical protein
MAAAAIHEQELHDARERERAIVDLIRRYEALRSTPGLARSVAHDFLAEALKRHERPVTCGERCWRWSRMLDDITSEPIHRVWRVPEDQNAPTLHRVGWDATQGPVPDLVEIQQPTE